MRKILCLVLLLALFIGSLPDKAYGENFIEFIDVRIDHTKVLDGEIVITSQAGFYFYQKDRKDTPILEVIDREIHIIASNSNVIEIYGIDGLLITTMPGDGSIIIGSQELNNSIIKVNENSYRDYISFIIKDGSLLVINHINIENYLFGVLPREIPARSHVDALRAQAVVARSFTYTNLNKHINEGFNLCNTVHCQVYGGYDAEHPNTNQAIIDTYGEYIVYDGKVISAFYHSSSGGSTESSEKVWGGSLPYLKSIVDPFSINAPNSSWSIELTPRELSDKLAANGIMVGEVEDLQILETTESERVVKIKIIGSLGEEIITGSTFRSILGTSSLKSTLFSVYKVGASSPKKVYVLDGSGQGPREISLSGIYTVDGYNMKTVSRSSSSRIKGRNSSANVEGTVSVKPTVFTFEGKGSGHGVGMSQYGAIEMANQGYNYNDIIKHYYSGVEILNLGK